MALSFPLQAGFQRYPTVFDINLDYTNTMNRLQYLVDGHYIDNATASVDLKLITFNGKPLGWRGGVMGVTITVGAESRSNRDVSDLLGNRPLRNLLRKLQVWQTMGDSVDSLRTRWTISTGGAFFKSG